MPVHFDLTFSRPVQNQQKLVLRATRPVLAQSLLFRSFELAAALPVLGIAQLLHVVLQRFAVAKN